MQGKIEIEVTDGSIGVSVRVKDVSAMDKMLIVHSVVQSLHMTPMEVQMFAVMETSDVLKSAGIEIMMPDLREDIEDDEV